jgi:hypothetical protein
VNAPSVIAISPDEALRERVAAALRMLTPTVDARPGLDGLPHGAHAALCVIHHDGEIAQAFGSILARLGGECRVIALLPRSSLATLVELMQMSDRVVGMIVVEDLDVTQLAALAARVLTRDIFGLEKVMSAGTQVYTHEVRGPEERAQCLAKISEAAELADVPPHSQTSIEQCIDEMLMNALYGAPVDETGKPVFANISAKTRASLTIDEPVCVQYACDDRIFAISVRDAFGTLQRSTLLRVLHKCLHATDKIDRKVSGAGVGLYLMLSTATSVYFNVVPGVATEAVCTFALERQATAVQQFGLFVEKVDITGKLAPARRYRAGSFSDVGRRSVVPFVAAGVVAAAAVVAGVLVVPRLLRDRRHAAAPPAAIVEVVSDPPGAIVEVAGKRLGGTPIEITTLPPGTRSQLVLRLRGYRDSTLDVAVPRAGERTRLNEKLAASDAFVRVHFTSTPPGARVVELPAVPGADRTYTPADVFVEVDRPHRFVLRMPHHAPAELEPFTPRRGDQPLERAVTLVEQSP